MKKLLILLALLISVSGYSQKYVQEFTKTDGTSIAISLSDLAFAIPSGTANGSVLVLGPNAKTIYVTDSLQGIVDSSAAILVLLEESYKLNGKDALRDIAISKQQVKEVVPSGASQTFVKLASPQKTVLINDDFATVAAALSAESGGGGVLADGNGIYSSSDTVQNGTLAITTDDAFGEIPSFGIGNFTGWQEPYAFEFDDGLQKGLYIDPNNNGVGIVSNAAGVNVSDNAATIWSKTTTSGPTTQSASVRVNTFGANSSFVISATQANGRNAQISSDLNNSVGPMYLFGGYSGSGSIRLCLGGAAPESVFTAFPGSLHFNTTTGDGEVFLKRVGVTATGWQRLSSEQGSASATLDFPSTPAGGMSELTITVTGAVVGSPVFVGAPAAIPDKGDFFARVTATNTVTIRYSNNDFITAKDPASGTFTVTVIQP